MAINDHCQEQYHQALWDVIKGDILWWIEGGGMVFITPLSSLLIRHFLLCSPQPLLV